MNESKEIEFYGDKLSAIKNDADGKVYVQAKQLVENFGLDWKTQLRKLTENPLLSSTMVIMTIVAQDSRKREMVMIPADSIPGWLMTLNVKKLDVELQPKVLRYHKEAYKVLSDVFMGPGFAVNPNPNFVDTNAMKAKLSELELKRHEMVLETTRRMLELNPNFSRISLARMIEVSVSANLNREIVNERVLLDVGAFLKEKGMAPAKIRKVSPGFGKMMKAAFIAKYGEGPGQHNRFVDGAERKVNVYTEEHRELMETVYKKITSH